MKVYLVLIIYQYDGLDEISVHSSKENAVTTADKAVAEFMGRGYELAEDCESIRFFDTEPEGDSSSVTLRNEDGDVRIEIEMKKVQE